MNKLVRSSILKQAQLGLQIQCLNGQLRNICTTSTCSGKRNFKMLFIGNKRGTKAHKEKRIKDRNYASDIPVYTNVKPIGYHYGDEFQIVPEMIPELIVPDLTDCKLKPYVSYRTNDEITQGEFTAQELFSYVYEEKIMRDYKDGKLDSNGEPVEPSEFEKLSADEGFLKARQTGSDLFSERVPKQWECLNINHDV